MVMTSLLTCGLPHNGNLMAGGSWLRFEGVRMADEKFFARAYDVVRQIPEGHVATYGQVARMVGEPRKARFVGFAMHSSPGVAGGVPCHRVVFKDGSLSSGFSFGGRDEQRRMLEDEGVSFLADGRVDMGRCAWEV